MANNPTSQVLPSSLGTFDFTGITYLNNKFYVSQIGSISIYDNSFNYLGTFDSGVTSLGQPAGLDNDGTNLWIADYDNSEVYKFTESGTLLLTLTTDGSTALSTPSDVKIDNNGNVWVVDQGNNRIVVFNATTGAFAFTFGTTGFVGNYEFSTPVGAAFNRTSSYMYIADAGNGRVQVYDLTGTYVKTVGGRGIGPGLFDSPFGLAIDGDLNLWAADNGSQKVVVFNSSDALVTEYLVDDYDFENIGAFTLANDSLYMEDATPPTYDAVTLWTWTDVPAQSDPVVPPQPDVDESKKNFKILGFTLAGDSLPGVESGVSNFSHGVARSSLASKMISDERTRNNP